MNSRFSIIMITIMTLFVQSQSFADAGSFPNDTKTKLVSYGNGTNQDCSIIKPVSGYFTKFNHPYGGAGKALVLVMEINNLSYNKEIAVTINNVRRTANFNYSNDKSSPLARYLGSSISNVDKFELIDYRVGPDDKIVVDMDVTMNGRSFSCHQIQIQ